MGGEFGNYAYAPLEDFDYGPYAGAMQNGSRPGAVDGIVPTLELTETAGPTIEGTAHDNLAIRAVRWTDDRGRSGVSGMNWEVLDGDYDSGYEWQTNWSFAAASVSAAAPRVEVVAEDIKGNESAPRVLVSSGGSGVWVPEPVMVDTKAPDTEITRKPGKRGSKRRVNFGYRSSENGGSFECRIDRRPWRPCDASGKRYRLSHRRHKFRVAAIDRSGNADPSAAAYTFRIVKR
jgi:hypothetical protein